MNTQERAEFVSAFTGLLTRAWSDEDYARQLETHPTETAAESGLTVPDGGQVVVVRDFQGEYRDGPDDGINAQIALWEAGRSTGRYELHVPRTPQVDTAELSEDQLEGVVGGYCRWPCCCS